MISWPIEFNLQLFQLIITKLILFINTCASAGYTVLVQQEHLEEIILRYFKSFVQFHKLKLLSYTTRPTKQRCVSEEKSRWWSLIDVSLLLYSQISCKISGAANTLHNRESIIKKNIHSVLHFVVRYGSNVNRAAEEKKFKKNKRVSRTMDILRVGESNPGLPRSAGSYSRDRRGAVWQAGILTTILTRISMLIWGQIKLYRLQIIFMKPQSAAEKKNNII